MGVGGVLHMYVEVCCFKNGFLQSLDHWLEHDRKQAHAVYPSAIFKIKIVNVFLVFFSCLFSTKSLSSLFLWFLCSLGELNFVATHSSVLLVDKCADSTCILVAKHYPMGTDDYHSSDCALQALVHKLVIIHRIIISLPFLEYWSLQHGSKTQTTPKNRQK